jgi:hypothetical protein
MTLLDDPTLISINNDPQKNKDKKELKEQLVKKKNVSLDIERHDVS